jgi:hypothetical protein
LIVGNVISVSWIGVFAMVVSTTEEWVPVGSRK